MSEYNWPDFTFFIYDNDSDRTKYVKESQAVKEIESLKQELAEAKMQIKGLQHELKMQLGVEEYRVRTIAIGALDKIGGQRISMPSKPVNGSDWMEYVARELTKIADEALKQIRGENE